MKKEIVFVGLSGGVDSAVSAALLQTEGYEVVGVFIKTWHPDFLECNEEGERQDAMRVAAHLDIPFLTFDLKDVYKRAVADYMIAEYKAGRTPNPDVKCNQEVKFGAFLKKAISMGADFVATGHYAQANKRFPFLGSLSGSTDPALPLGSSACETPQKGKSLVCLYKGKDPAKDQSYFLWTLKQEQLKKILFPVGKLKKTTVRQLAKKFNLPVAEKKDSQGICFLGAVDLKEFLKHYIKEKRGKVINEKGEEIGYHNGVFFNTLGERHGFIITKKTPNDRPYYVIGKDVKKNILIVSQDKNYLAKTKKLSWQDNFCLTLENTNWIAEIPTSNKDYLIQIRYHGEFFASRIKIKKDNKAEVILTKPVMAAAGQSCVVYDQDICLGGGVIV